MRYRDVEVIPVPLLLSDALGRESGIPCFLMHYDPCAHGLVYYITLEGHHGFVDKYALGSLTHEDDNRLIRGGCSAHK